MSVRDGDGLNHMAVVGWEGVGQSRSALEQFDLGGVVENVSSQYIPSFPTWGDASPASLCSYRRPCDQGPGDGI